jgi:predicted nuclease of predicted toxin-antitoxin system
MKILVDMNLSPEWLTVLEQAGWQASHWSAVGSPTAPDTDLLAWARQQGWVVLTQDIDFAELLFHTQAGTPSVVLLRLGNELGSAQQARVCALLRTAAAPLETGALLVIDEHRARLRRLPIEIGRNT